MKQIKWVIKHLVSGKYARSISKVSDSGIDKQPLEWVDDISLANRFADPIAGYVSIPEFKGTIETRHMFDSFTKLAGETIAVRIVVEVREMTVDEYEPLPENEK